MSYPPTWTAPGANPVGLILRMHKPNRDAFPPPAAIASPFRLMGYDHQLLAAFGLRLHFCVMTLLPAALAIGRDSVAGGTANMFIHFAAVPLVGLALFLSLRRAIAVSGRTTTRAMKSNTAKARITTRPRP